MPPLCTGTRLRLPLVVFQTLGHYPSCPQFARAADNLIARDA